MAFTEKELKTLDNADIIYIHKLEKYSGNKHTFFTQRFLKNSGIELLVRGVDDERISQLKPYTSSNKIKSVEYQRKIVEKLPVINPQARKVTADQAYDSLRDLLENTKANVVVLKDGGFAGDGCFFLRSSLYEVPINQLNVSDSPADL